MNYHLTGHLLETQASLNTFHSHHHRQRCQLVIKLCAKVLLGCLLHLADSQNPPLSLDFKHTLSPDSCHDLGKPMYLR